VNGHDQKELATLALEVKRRVLTLEGIKDVVIYQTNPSLNC